MAAGRVKGTPVCSPCRSSDSARRAPDDTKHPHAGSAKTYAGLDVSLRETAICVVDKGGKILFERMVATDPHIIATHLRKYAPGLDRFGLESGSTSAWLWREFRHLGLPVIWLDSRHAHRVLSMKRNKNNRNDARGLADLVRMGWYREARV
jgi:transposase